MEDLQTEIAKELIHARNLDRDIQEAYAKWFPEGTAADSREMFHAFVRELKRLQQATKRTD